MFESSSKPKLVSPQWSHCCMYLNPSVSWEQNSPCDQIYGWIIGYYTTPWSKDHVWWTLKNWGGSGRGLFQYTVSVFTWND